MAIDQESAVEDLRKKVRLEQGLRSELVRVDKSLVRSVIRSFGSQGTLPNVFQESKDSLEPILLAHMRAVGDQFKSGVSRRLPEDVAITEEESRELEAALVALFAIRAGEDSTEIANTNDENARRSVFLARQEKERLQEEESRPVDVREEALLVGVFFSRSLNGLVGSRASFQTQTAAESSKFLEVGTLLNLELASTPRDRVAPPAAQEAIIREILKEWVSQGDNRVRSDHLEADSTQVPVSDPFIVGGERLMHPGDTSLGATAKNIVRCRCSAVFDVDGIAEARRQDL